MTRLTALLGLVLIGIVGLGCAPVQYTQIPPLEGQRVARHDPNRTNVRTVSALALDAVAENRGFTGPVRITLPEHSTDQTYAAIAAAMDTEAVPAGELAEDQAPTMEVRQIRLRGSRAELDIVQSSPGDVAQLVEVHLRHQGLRGWELERVHPWRLGSDLPRRPTPEPDAEEVEEVEAVEEAEEVEQGDVDDNDHDTDNEEESP